MWFGIGVGEGVAAGLGGLAAVEAVGSVGAAFGEEGDGGRGVEGVGPDDAVAPGGLAFSARAEADGVAGDADGVGVFEGLDGGVEGVGHVGVQRAAAGPA